MSTRAKSYGDTVNQARALVAQARLRDPDEHFPYKHDDVTALLADNPPMGPGTPSGADGADDRSREVADYMSQGIADATRDYIDAQAAYLADLTEETRAAYEAARDRLAAARLDHRQHRADGFTVGAAARRGA